MRAALRSVLKITPIYQYYKNYRDMRQFCVLSEDDKQMAVFYKQFIEPGDLVFDVGANMGNRTKIFLHLDARTIAFEPQKQCADYLKSVLKKSDKFTLIEAALGAEEGEAEMLISNMHSISTLSQQWVRVTKESGRFSQYEWNEKQRVCVTTLDNAIETFGVPSFIKIDVEGYEFEVLSGLTKPIEYISIEFAAEIIENTYKCIEYMSSLSNVSFQLSQGESMDFYLPKWVSKTEIKRILSDLCAQNKLVWGDVYIKYTRRNS